MVQPTLVLSDPSSTDVTIRIIDSEVSATGQLAIFRLCIALNIIYIKGGVDYISGPYVVTIPAGVTNVSFDVSIRDDDELENDEHFNLTIDPSSLPSRITITDPSQAVVTITDNEGE